MRWSAASPAINFFKKKREDTASPINTEGKKGLELGSGTGALGLYLIKYGKFDEFHLTDFDLKV